MPTPPARFAPAPGYGEALAYIHDAGYSGFAQKAAPGLLRMLRRQGVTAGLVVDLGCGSGRWARELLHAGYQVLGIDLSPAMIRLARRIAPQARFKVGSLFEAELPPCRAVTSLGECVNYNLDGKSSRPSLSRLFKRIFRALAPGGILVFDFAGPGRLPKRGPRVTWAGHDDWAVISVTRARGCDKLIRQITGFRRRGKHLRATGEVHDLRLYRADDLIQDLARCGFRARVVSGYGRLRFLEGIAGIVAVKPKKH